MVSGILLNQHFLQQKIIIRLFVMWRIIECGDIYFTTTIYNKPSDCHIYLSTDRRITFPLKCNPLFLTPSTTHVVF